MKQKLHSNNDAAIEASEDSGLHEQIRRRAHEIWLANDCPQGEDLRHWLEAEREVLGRFQRQSRRRS